MASEENDIRYVCEYGRRTQNSSGQFYLMAAIALSFALVTGHALDLHPLQQTGCTIQSRVLAQVSPNGPVSQAVEMFKFSAGQYPNRLQDLVVAPRYLAYPAKWTGPYLRDPSDLQDPWGHDYRYQWTTHQGPAGPVNGYRIWSVGPDGRDQTPDDISPP